MKRTHFLFLAAACFAAEPASAQSSTACDVGLEQVTGDESSCCWPGQGWNEEAHQCVGRPSHCPADAVRTADDCRFDMGHVTLSSSPASAVTVGGESYGVSPVHLTLPVGMHRVEMTRFNGEVEAYDIQVFPGHNEYDHEFSSRRPRASARIPRTGRLAVNTIPPADVFLNGRRVGRTPLDIEVPPGRHNVRMRTPNLEEEVSVLLRAGNALLIARNLQSRRSNARHSSSPRRRAAAPAPSRVAREVGDIAHLTINPTPAALVTIDGELVGPTPLRVPLAPGHHRITLEDPVTGASRTVNAMMGHDERALTGPWRGD